MQIFVKTIHGATITLQAFDVDSLRSEIEKEEGIASSLQRLIHGASELTTGSLVDNGLEEGSTVHLTLNLEGGRDPILRLLPVYHRLYKKICRRCYGQQPPNATRCRHARCGRTTNLRPKKLMWYHHVPPPEVKINTLYGFLKHYTGWWIPEN